MLFVLHWPICDESPDMYFYMYLDLQGGSDPFRNGIIIKIFSPFCDKGMITILIAILQ